MANDEPIPEDGDEIGATGTRCGEPCEVCGRPCVYLGGKTHDGHYGKGGYASRHLCERHTG